MTPASRPIGEDDLHGLVDKRLDPERQLQVERYLAENPAVAARVAGWQEDRAALRNAFAAMGHEPIPARLDVRRLAASRAARRWSTPVVGAGLAASLVIGIGIGWWGHSPVRPGSVTQVAFEAAAAHRFLAPGAQQIGWASPQVMQRLAAPDLAAAGYTLKDRQVMATNEGVGAVFLYQNEAGNSISVFVRPMVRHDVTMPMQPVANAAGWAWASGGLGVSLISTEQFPALHGLANEVRRQFQF